MEGVRHSTKYRWTFDRKHWIWLLQWLNIGEHLIKSIESDYCNDNKRCCRVMLHKWLKGPVHTTWEVLINAVDKVSDDATGLCNNSYYLLVTWKLKFIHTVAILECVMSQLYVLMVFVSSIVFSWVSVFDNSYEYISKAWIMYDKCFCWAIFRWMRKSIRIRGLLD